MCMQRLRKKGRQWEASVPTNGKFSLRDKWSNVLFQHCPMGRFSNCLPALPPLDPRWTPAGAPLEGSEDNRSRGQPQLVCGTGGSKATVNEAGGRERWEAGAKRRLRVPSERGAQSTGPSGG